MLHPQHALAVYAESLAADRRVAVLGDSSVGLGDRLADLGARAVQVWDPDEERALREAERAPPGVDVRGLPLSEDDMRPGAVDLALIADLGLFDDPQAVLSLVRRAVGDHGIAIVAAANRDVAPSDVPAFDYYELFDLVAGEFEDVRMVAQLPFYGVALAELGREDEAPAVSVDTQLAEAGRAPEAFVAIASRGGASLEPYAIVELPAPPPAFDEGGEEREVEEAAAIVAQAQLRAQALAGQLEEVRSRLADVERASASAIADHAEQLRDRTARALDLERALAHRAQQLAELSAEVEEMRATAEAGRVATAQVEEMARRADRAERALAVVEVELSRLSEAHSVELVRFEEALRDRAQAIRGLESELLRRDRMVRELVEALEEGAGRPPQAPGPGVEVPADAGAGPEAGGAAADDALARENARLRERLDSLALDLARREGEAQAAAWSVAELEAKLEANEPRVARAPGGARSEPELEPRLAAALDELDALRQAVAQEHSQRLKAESGEELARARAEIQRQAALLEELGHGDQTSAGGLHSPGK
jgi:hypothetical protein